MVKEVETNLTNRRIMEALHTQRRLHTINLDCGVPSSVLTTPLPHPLSLDYGNLSLTNLYK